MYKMSMIYNNYNICLVYFHSYLYKHVDNLIELSKINMKTWKYECYYYKWYENLIVPLFKMVMNVIIVCLSNNNNNVMIYEISFILIICN